MPAAWPVAAHSVAICEGLEDWGAATDFSNISDSDEDDQPAPLVRVPGQCGPRRRGGAWWRITLSLLVFQVAGRYRVMVESSMASADDIVFNCGDVIQLLQEELSGMW